MWPFLPENQHFHDESQIQYKRRDNFEIYGPIWILVTLIIEFSILGHMQQALTAQVLAFYNVQKIFKITFLLAVYFFVTPFIAYLIFKNKGAFEVSYLQLFMIYSYSFAVFVPTSLVYVLVPLYRFRWLLLLGSTAISLYYVYKEVRELVQKYFDWESFKNLAWFAGLCSGAFMLLMRYYIMSS